MNRMREIFMAGLFIILALEGVAQASRKNLTTVLNELAQSRGVIISFSPNLTNGLYPEKIPGGDGDVSSALKGLLAGRNLEFKCVKTGLYYIYEGKAVVRKAKPVVPKVVAEAAPVKPEPVDSVSDPVLQPVEKKIPLALKSNILYDATSTLNLGVEIGIAPGWTLDLSANYNGWAFSGSRKMRHFLIQPEVRYWTGECYESSFWGVHAHYATYNVGGILGMEGRYKGWLAGAGVSYGKYWRINDTWAVETSVGVGYTYLNHDKYSLENTAGKIYGSRPQHYFGIDKLAVSLVYILK